MFSAHGQCRIPQISEKQFNFIDVPRRDFLLTACGELLPHALSFKEDALVPVFGDMLRRWARACRDLFSSRASSIALGTAIGFSLTSHAFRMYGLLLDCCLEVFNCPVQVWAGYLHPSDYVERQMPWSGRASSD